VLLSHWVGLVLTIVSIAATVCFLLHDARQKSGLRRFGPLLLCMVSAPFLVLNQAAHLLEDMGHLQESAHLDHMIMAAAWVGSCGTAIAVFWNANLVPRIAAAMQGEEWGGCADNQ